MKDVKGFFSCLGEIWRDITVIEFMMRCAIAKTDGDLAKLPDPPYEKGKVYSDYPDSFSHYSFEIIVEKFNKRYPSLKMAKELVMLRDAMAHGLTVEVNKSGVPELIKFKEDKVTSTLVVEFRLELEEERLEQIRRSLMEFRRYIAHEIDDGNS
jgi:hypothetical protein